MSSVVTLNFIFSSHSSNNQAEMNGLSKNEKSSVKEIEDEIAELEGRLASARHRLDQLNHPENDVADIPTHPQFTNGKAPNFSP